MSIESPWMRCSLKFLTELLPLAHLQVFFCFSFS
uniref:Uncharacterized protein n=1 Tax=Rhizophora mucronata TaxID=61149 RepID=A0A2P2K3A0_RHIMU